MPEGHLLSAIPLVRNLSSPVVLVIGLVLAVLSYVRTVNFKRRTGRNPWGIPPVAWGIATLFISILGTILSIIACATTKPAAPGPYGPGPGGYAQGPGQPYPGTSAAYGAQGFYGNQGAHGGQVSATATGGTATPASPWPTTAAGWVADPAGRHQLRYHDGTSYTEHVANDGVASTDPV